MHPRANGQVKRANGMILDVLKKRLYKNEQKHPQQVAQGITSCGLGNKDLT